VTDERGVGDGVVVIVGVGVGVKIETSLKRAMVVNGLLGNCRQSSR
jgi:hypothetical protein